MAPFEPIDDGTTLSLRLPPQGGYVLWIGAEVSAVATPQLEIRGRLRSKATGIIIAEEARSIAVEPVVTDSNSVRPAPVSIRNVTNLPVCPNYGDEEFLGLPLVLEVRVEDLSTDPPGLGVATRDVQLACLGESTNCLCECSLGYVLGQCGPSTEVPPDN